MENLEEKLKSIISYVNSIEECAKSCIVVKNGHEKTKFLYEILGDCANLSQEINNHFQQLNPNQTNDTNNYLKR